MNEHALHLGDLIGPRTIQPLICVLERPQGLAPSMILDMPPVQSGSAGVQVKSGNHDLD
jgi:hypothetical protein